MATQDDINKDLYGKVNDLTKEFAQTNGYLKAIVGQNVELIGLLKKSLYTLACIAFICVLGSLFALIYGAIGRDGLHAVRQAIPERIADMPGAGDLDKWSNLGKNKEEV